MQATQDGVISFLEHSHCSEMMTKLHNLIADFKTKNGQMYQELKTSEHNLRKLETDYKSNEQQFVEMVNDYHV